ncbi:MAG: ATP-binding protein [Bacteroidota bacterium]
MIALMVQDDGMGISEENLQKLFRIDTTISTKGTQNETGTGLGLLLIKEFVEKNLGSITVESEEKKGTKFQIHFPAIGKLEALS